ncbi:MAG: protein kinase [Acidobacteriota bacterium]|nr:protein kinase [Acidobacteriota bacterium]
MTRERWEQIETLYHNALAVPANERKAFLAKACAGDPSLLGEVEVLLAANDQAGSFMVKPAVHNEAKFMFAEAQPMKIGQRISHYQIVSRIGEGGMGEVWLAEDKNLGRQVAIKLLPAEFTGDADRLRRFEQEARAASALNHPNIVTVHEIGEVDGLHFLVTEFVNGRTLRQLLADGRLPSVQVLDIAEQIAEALAAAHGAGIIHRDIKPENVMLRRDGYVKVLDFGLAKLTAIAPADSGSLSQMDTLRAAQTNPGVILGTPRYMSPEQARGTGVDSRTDLFSLGVVIYELLTGEPPFTGETLSDVIAAILMAAPKPLAEAAPATPPQLQTIVGKLLEKKTERRYQTADELLSDLQECKTDLQISARMEHRLQVSSQQTAILPAANSSQAFWKAPKVWASALVLVAAFTAGGWWLTTRRDSSSSAPTVWQPKTIMNWRSSTTEGNPDYRFSPGGEFIAFSGIHNGRRQIHLNQSGEDNALPITNDEWNNANPIWSPDGREIAYISRREGKAGIWRMPKLGGSATLIAQLEQSSSLLRNWSADGKTIYYESFPRLFMVEIASGKVRDTTPVGAVDLFSRRFSVSPDGKKVVYRGEQKGQEDLWVSRLDGGTPRQITNDAAVDSDPVWHPDGERIFYSSVRNDVNQIFVTNPDGKPPSQLTFGQSDYLVSDAIALSDGVRIIFSTGRNEADLWRVNVATGEGQQLSSDLNFDLWPAAAPDGKRIAYQSVVLREPTQSISSEKSGLAIRSLAGEDKPRPLVTGAERLSWSPDGKQIAFLRTTDGKTNLWLVEASTRKERQLTTNTVSASPHSLLPRLVSQPHDYDWSPDSSRIVYAYSDDESTQLRLVKLDDNSQAATLHKAANGEIFYCPTWSPDGQQIAFVYQVLPDSKNKLRWGVAITELATGQTRLAFQAEFALRLLGWSENGQDLWLAYGSGKFSLTAGHLQVQISQLSIKQQQLVSTFALPSSSYLYNTYLSPNKRFIGFTVQQNERDSLWVIPVTGGASKKLVSSDETRTYFSALSWSPDSREIYYGKQVSWRLISMIDNYK